MEQRIEELKECFAEVDLNGDGSIQMEEFASLVQNLDSEASQEDCRIGFKEVDVNGDGKICFEEFYKWWLDH